MTYLEAIRNTLLREARRDENIFLIGEDIGIYGGAFGVTRGLLDALGPDRVRDTPISEGTLVGISTGAAFLGMRPILEIMFMDFLTLCVDQIANHMTKFRYLFGDGVSIPVVIRTAMGGWRGYGPSHSQCLESMFLSIPGLKIVSPSNCSDAMSLLESSIRDNDPVLFLEHKLLYPTTWVLKKTKDDDMLGKARIIKMGSDATIVSYSYLLYQLFRNLSRFQAKEMDVELIDLRTIKPIDWKTIESSVKKTGRLIIVEEGCRTGGVGAEIAATIQETCLYYLNSPIERVAALDFPIPANRNLEKHVLPSIDKVIESVNRTIGG